MSVRGERPPAVNKPTSGIWWVKVARPRYVPSTVPSNEPCNSYYTWDGAAVEWHLLNFDLNDVDWFGSDEGNNPWENIWMAPVQLGPRVQAPEE